MYNAARRAVSKKKRKEGSGSGAVGGANPRE